MWGKTVYRNTLCGVRWCIITHNNPRQAPKENRILKGSGCRFHSLFSTARKSPKDTE